MKENSIKNEQSSIGDRIEEKYTRYLNCETDTLELTTEEAIFMLEMDESFHYVEDLLQEAYKVILSDYKRVLKINEVLVKENKELKNNYINVQDSTNTTFCKVAIPPEPQLPTKTLCESFSKKVRNK